MKTFSFVPVMEEICSKFPFLLDIMCAISLTDDNIKTKSLKRVHVLIPRWCLVYGMLTHARFPKMSGLQRMVTCLLMDCNSDQKV